MKQYKIMGTYFPKTSNFGHEKEGYFSGEIDVKEDGSFLGIINDAYGTSVINGTVDQQKLEFTKTYGKGPQEGTIFFYHLHKRDELVGFSGGWKNKTYLTDTGKVKCALFLTHEF